MASLDSHLKFNLAPSGGSARFPQSSMSFNWRDDPAIPVFRQFIKQRIAIFLAKNSSGDFSQFIDSLSTEFEFKIFSSAASKEEFLNEEALMVWLRFLVQDKLLSNSSAQEVVYSTSPALPPLPHVPFVVRPEHGPCSNLADAIPGSGMAASTTVPAVGSNHYSGANTFPGLRSQAYHCERKVPLAHGSKHSLVTSLSPNLNNSNITFPGLEAPHTHPVDSNLTFSGSVLQYESEASFESNSKTQHISEGELDSVVASKQNPCFFHSPPTLEGSFTDRSDAWAHMTSSPSSTRTKGLPHLPVMDSKHSEEHQWPISQLNDRSSGRLKSSLRHQMLDSNAFMLQPEGNSVCAASTSYTLSSASDDLKSIAFDILSTYIVYKCSPATRGHGHPPFLQFLHSKRCQEKCTCQWIKSMLCHFDSCASPQCDICGPPLNKLEKDRRLERICPSSDGFRSQGYDCLKAKSRINAVASPSPSKGGNVSDVASMEVPTLIPDPPGPLGSPNLKRCSGKMLSSDSVDLKLTMEMDADLTKSPACVDDCKNDSLDHQQELVSSNASRGSEESVEEPRNRIMNPRSSHKRRMEEGGLESTSGIDSEAFPAPAKCRKVNSLGKENVLDLKPSSVSFRVSTSSKKCILPSSPLDFDDQDLHMETDVYAKNYACSDDYMNDYTDDEQRLDSINASADYEVPSYCRKTEIEPARGCDVVDIVSENTLSPAPHAMSDVSKSCIGQNEDTFTQSNSEQAGPCRTGFFHEHMGHSKTLMKLEKLKLQGVSLTEYFDAEEVKNHIQSLRQKCDQTTSEQEIGNSMDHCVGDNICQLCNSEKLWFPPVPIYCSACGSRVKYRGTYYYMLDDHSAQFCLCSACYNKSRGGNKSKMEMKKNDVVTEEAWVQCDKCEGWQHQICALFNDKRDLEGKAEYTCPRCYLEQLEAGKCNPLPWTTSFGASNLPRTALSDHLEKRLIRQLKHEREDRAVANGINLEEVPEASDLVVRVVSSVDKILKVKQQFLDIFPDKNYPAEFPYRSKVILLFQKIEGADVCLFGLYVQEFGSQCSQPNQRCLYISYLDSVKYFRPDTRTVAGEALRTYVYHEILIGYLEYCKRRGFSTCYIWACPPVKGEDYILYCHPEVQKTPKPDKLRQWYQSMLRKATKEKIVVNYTNIYEQFFVPSEGCNNKVTAARLPYFDGDYWSSVAENMIKKIEQECAGDLQKKVKKITRRSLKAMGHTNPTDGDAKDILLMQELGQNIASAKEDFIIVYLQPICTHCHEVIASGTRWYCGQCKNFQLCEGCHGAGTNSQGSHVTSSGQKHELFEEAVKEVPADTEDNDVIMKNCFLENRHAVLSFCQGNHYQFDTLRRAKHSSMMILYHLHHPTAATAGTTSCCLCLRDIALDPRWKCELCPDFNVCCQCYQRNGIGCHTHNLSQHSPQSDPGRKNKIADMIRELLNVVLHASKCHSMATLPCKYPNCQRVRRLFLHARSCNIRVANGCPHCKKVWSVLIMHSRICVDFNCGVPRCRDLKEFGERRDLRDETRPPETKSDDGFIF